MVIAISSNLDVSRLFVITLFAICADPSHSLLRDSHKDVYKNETIVHQRKIIPENLLTAIILKYFQNGTNTSEKSELLMANGLENKDCIAEKKISIILHGWIQSCDDEWVAKLINRLSFYRGGCIICIDYRTIAKSSYMNLYANFNLLVEAVVSIILKLIDSGLDVDKAYMFGFSFGGQLASAVGRTLSPSHHFGNIDTCDMAGPGFDGVDTDHRKAAKHVQCFHSSQDKGTSNYNCHTNILLGNCGYNQAALVSQSHLGSHGLCHNIYINAFDYPFYALRNPPKECLSVSKGAAKNVPHGYRIGYNDKWSSHILGKVFVPTSLNYPYNLSKKQMHLKL